MPKYGGLHAGTEHHTKAVQQGAVVFDERISAGSAFERARLRKRS
jgi:hypothetical protein